MDNHQQMLLKNQNHKNHPNLKKVKTLKEDSQDTPLIEKTL